MIFRRRLENVNRQTADWLARLHADDRSAEDEARFRDWLNASNANKEAFESASSLWTSVGGLREGYAPERIAMAPEPVLMSRRTVMAGGGAAVVMAGATLGWQTAYAGVYRTEIGEQRRFQLADGTRAMLDTDTQIRFRVKDDLRLLALQSGRVDLDIAPDSRPFVIDLGDRQAFANQARIDARRTDAVAQLTTISGVAQVENSSGDKLMLPMGSRVAIANGRRDRIDQPELEDLIAWQSGRLAFRDNTLREAIGEFNRYSTRVLVVDDPAVAALRISGVYRAGDSEAFARSLALLLPVTVSVDGDSIKISADR
ncbi:FecR domain-containing protein [Novosphingobium sp.]|uniref:FecR family protein n=1 Tax=Novosphingobium sp. TaxID=1874826 RepID=UPI0026236E6E|nr:FecR domain-containing protein [Novosphingobium sp.]